MKGKIHPHKKMKMFLESWNIWFLLTSHRCYTRFYDEIFTLYLFAYINYYNIDLNHYLALKIHFIHITRLSAVWREVRPPPAASAASEVDILQGNLGHV